jgi:protein TonB
VRTAGIEAEPEPFLDLEYALSQAAPEQPIGAASWQRGLWFGLVLSLAVHLLPLLLLLPWKGAPVEVPAPPIPVQLIIEQPPPPPPPAPVAQPQPAAKPPRGRLASEDVGAKADEPNDTAVTQPSDKQPEVEPDQKSTAKPEPELKQAASLLQPDQQPTLLGREALALPEPVLEPLPEQPATPVSSHEPGPSQRSRLPQRAAAIVGPPAVRDEYLAHLVTLIRPHLYLLPPELIQGRRGTTSLAIRVLGDGTIARIAVSQSSGYPDIDNRVMQIVAAVGRFPPLPSWIEQPSWDINFHLRFPFPRAGTERR